MLTYEGQNLVENKEKGLCIAFDLWEFDLGNTDCSF